ncbi:ATP-binding protein [Streptomyces boluensis]|uniref:AAA family ATPase n=1 Tax=Streptomyces boluensis TaxID=1775135 RepID=A0A964XPW9_9ACTN|nr:AAA family ATPase [Streptomyces boluensis]NBE55671.1 AAA family ATPase [Streptomyces boluensis]
MRQSRGQRPERGGPVELIGRERELTQLRALLARHRMVTVTGAPGIGKSRLARAVAEEPGGLLLTRVRWWSQGPVGGPDALAGVAAALGLAGSAEFEEVAERLRARPRLLLLDDVDPVRDGLVALVQRLLQALPGLRVLATGRQPLGLGAEAVLRLGPLSLTAPGDGSPSPAARMFLARVARGANVTGTGAAGRAVVDICARLQGVPLALRLAAEQVGRHPLAEVATLVESGQYRLSGRGGDMWRHRSLHAALGASYTLCGRAERITWARLSVLGGEFDEETAVFVGAGGQLRAQSIPACLARLTLASVLEPVRDPGGVLPGRYRMGTAVREFGFERLRDAGESAEAVERHLTWCRETAESAQRLWQAGLQQQAVAQVRAAEANLRAALVRPPRSAAQAETALHTVVALWFWWGVCGHTAQGRSYLQRLLPVVPEASLLRARALWLAGWLAVRSGEGDAAELLREAGELAVLVGDDTTLGHVADASGVLAAFSGDRELAVACLKEAVDLVPEGVFFGPSVAHSWAVLACNQAHTSLPEARRSARYAAALPGTRDDRWARCSTGYALAFVDHLSGRRSRAWRRARRTLGDAEALGSPLGQAVIEKLLAEIQHFPATAPPLPDRRRVHRKRAGTPTRYAQIGGGRLARGAARPN